MKHFLYWNNTFFNARRGFMCCFECFSRLQVLLQKHVLDWFVLSTDSPLSPGVRAIHSCYNKRWRDGSDGEGENNIPGDKCPLLLPQTLTRPHCEGENDVLGDECLLLLPQTLTRPHCDGENNVPGDKCLLLLLQTLTRPHSDGENIPGDKCLLFLLQTLTRISVMRKRPQRSNISNEFLFFWWIAHGAWSFFPIYVTKEICSWRLLRFARFCLKPRFWLSIFS
jgi:hypothetical protein